MKKTQYGMYQGEWVKASPVDDGIEITYLDGEVEYVSIHGFGLQPPIWKPNKVKQFGSPKRVDTIKNMPCTICAGKPCDAAHTTSRGAGGTYRDIVPLCRSHHDEQHMIGVQTFDAKYNVSLDEAAKRLASKLDLTCPIIPTD